MDDMGTFDELLCSGKDFAKLLTSSNDDNDNAEKPLPISRRTSARVCGHLCNFSRVNFLITYACI